MIDKFYLDISKKHCIRSLAALSGLTYKDIAKQLDVHPVMICYVMNGQRRISAPMYKRMMSYLKGSAQSSVDALSALDEAYKEFER